MFLIRAVWLYSIRVNDITVKATEHIVPVFAFYDACTLLSYLSFQSGVILYIKFVCMKSHIKYFMCEVSSQTTDNEKNCVIIFTPRWIHFNFAHTNNLTKYLR